MLLTVTIKAKWISDKEMWCDEVYSSVSNQNKPHRIC